MTDESFCNALSPNGTLKTLALALPLPNLADAQISPPTSLSLQTRFCRCTMLCSICLSRLSPALGPCSMWIMRIRSAVLARRAENAQGSAPAVARFDVNRSTGMNDGLMGRPSACQRQGNEVMPLGLVTWYMLPGEFVQSFAAAELHE